VSRWAGTPLLLLLPLLWQAGFTLAARATGGSANRRLALLLAPGCAGAAWLFAIHCIGLATHSFYVGLFAGTSALAGLGAWSWYRTDLETPDPSLPRRRGVAAWKWIALLLAIAAIAGPEVRWSEHDECLVTGHVSLPLEIQNGIYPPRYSSFPQFEVRYHYAVDLAAAVASTLLGRLPMQPTVHLLAVALWGYSFLLLWTLGESLIGGAWAGPITGFGVLLAGGAPYFCRGLKPLSLYLISDCGPGGTWITPPLISNFLQHPWSLGIPIFVIILLLLPFLHTEAGNPWWWATFSLLFAMLSLSQAVLFACLLPTVVVAAWVAGDRKLRRLVVLLVWAAGILVTARLMHGFFAPGLEPKAGSIEFQPFWRETTLRGWLSWNWDAMGLMLPFGIAGFFLLPRTASRWVLAILAAGGLLARNLLKYSHSWDIVKFSMVSQIALALLSAALIVRALQQRGTRLLGVAGLLLCTFFGIGWSAALAFDMPSVWFCRDLTPLPTVPDQAAIAFLRNQVREGEGVFTTQFPDAYAIYGGLGTPSWDWGIASFGFSPELFALRKELVEHPPSEPGPYLKQSFRWIVVRDSEPRQEADVARWAREGKAELAVELPPLRVYRISSPDGSR